MQGCVRRRSRARSVSRGRTPVTVWLCWGALDPGLFVVLGRDRITAELRE